MLYLFYLRGKQGPNLNNEPKEQKKAKDTNQGPGFGIMGTNARFGRDRIIE